MGALSDPKELLDILVPLEPKTLPSPTDLEEPSLACSGVQPEVSGAQLGLEGDPVELSGGLDLVPDVIVLREKGRLRGELAPKIRQPRSEILHGLWEGLEQRLGGADHPRAQVVHPCPEGKSVEPEVGLMEEIVQKNSSPRHPLTATCQEATLWDDGLADPHFCGKEPNR